MPSLRTPRRFAAVVAFCVAVAPIGAAQLPPPKPKPKPAEKTASRPPGTLLVEVDEPASLTVDGRFAGEVTPGDPRRVAVTFGRHTLRVTSLRTGATWQDVVEVKDAAQEVVRVRIKDSVDQRVWIAEQRTAAAGQSGPGEKTVLLAVDPSLRPLIREHAQALAASRIRPGPGIPGFEALPADGIAEPHAALKLDPPRPGGEIEMAGTKLRNCGVTAQLSLTRQGVPVTWPIEGVGAGASDGAACNEAARRAVASALTPLVNVLRRDGR